MRGERGDSRAPDVLLPLTLGAKSAEEQQMELLQEPVGGLHSVQGMGQTFELPQRPAGSRFDGEVAFAMRLLGRDGVEGGRRPGSGGVHGSYYSPRQSSQGER